MEKKLETKPDFMDKRNTSLSGHANFKSPGLKLDSFFLCQS
jgi:hypothetical protein